LQKLKGFSFSTKLSVIGITTLAEMVIINNHANGLHNLQDLNNKTMDLVRSFFLHSFIYVFCYNEIVNDVDVFLFCPFFWCCFSFRGEKSLSILRGRIFASLLLLWCDDILSI